MSFDPVSALFGVGQSIIERLWPDPKMQAEQKIKLAELAQNGDLAELDAHVKSLTGQLDINKAEAHHKSVFVSGWRPFIGWVCGVGIAWNFIVQPLISWVVFLFDVDLMGAPNLDIGDLMTLLLGMLGLSAQRSYEKKHRVNSDSLTNNKTVN